LEKTAWKSPNTKTRSVFDRYHIVSKTDQEAFGKLADGSFAGQSGRRRAAWTKYGQSVRPPGEISESKSEGFPNDLVPEEGIEP
jgi:hypothetical protein